MLYNIEDKLVGDVHDADSVRCWTWSTYRIVVALGLVDLCDLHEAGVSTLERIDSTFEILVLLGQLGDVLLVYGTEALTSLLVEVAERLADVLELGRDIGGDVVGELLPLVHFGNVGEQYGDDDDGTKEGVRGCVKESSPASVVAACCFQFVQAAVRWMRSAARLRSCAAQNSACEWLKSKTE